MNIRTIFDMENKTRIKLIEVGKFYFIHDDSKTGHPGFVVWKDDTANRYLVARFDSDKEGDIPKTERGIRHITKLKHATDSNVVNSYVRNRPMLCKRKDFGIIDLSNMNLHPSKDYQLIKKYRIDTHMHV